MPEPVLVALVFAAAALVRATVGFGDALVAMPLLAMVVPLQVASPLSAAVSILLGVGILMRSSEHVRWGATRDLLLGAALGVPCGVVLLRLVAARPIELLLGVVLVGYGLFALFGRRASRDLLPGRLTAVLIGATAGVLGGSLNTSGPPVVIYSSLRAWDPATTRASLQGFFLPVGLIIAASHAIGGLWTWRVGVDLLATLPGVLIALTIGQRLHGRLDPERFRNAVHILLVGMGLLTLLR